MDIHEIIDFITSHYPCEVLYEPAKMQIVIFMNANNMPCRITYNEEFFKYKSMGEIIGTLEDDLFDFANRRANKCIVSK